MCPEPLHQQSPAVSFTLSLSLWVWPFVSSLHLIRTPVIRSRVPPNQYDLILLRSCPKRPYFWINSYPQIAGGKARTSFSGVHTPESVIWGSYLLHMWVWCEGGDTVQSLEVQEADLAKLMNIGPWARQLASSGLDNLNSMVEILSSTDGWFYWPRVEK